jgi:integration host factor subunit alpha
MGALTKADIAKTLNERFGFSVPESKDLVDEVFEAIRVSLESGHHVKISGFGNFELRDKGERPGRNPKTGEPIPVEARRVVTFKAGQKLRELVEAIPADENGGQ